MDGKERILIVDDEESIRRTLSLIFKRKGYEAEAVGTGGEALKKAQDVFFNLVLLDIRLPDMEGIELLAPLKEMHPDMEMIMCTAYASTETAVRSLNEGASAYITKPLNMDMMLATVKGVLEKQRLVWEKRHAEEVLQRSLEELKRSNFELDEYTYVVSHDLRAPLRTITAFSEFLLEDYKDKLDETGQEYLNRIKTASKRMDRFIQDLLVLSRVGRKYRDTELVDLNKLMDEITLDFDAQLEEKGAEILVGELPTITTQKVWMRQLFANLIGNGLKFNVSPTPRVEVSCEEHQSDYLFSVKDNGIGIKEEDQSRLFRLFKRLHTQDEYPGTGAGLAICRKIVESFRGKIWVESKPGVGSTFNFTYPKETFPRVKGPRPQDLSLQPIEAIKAIQTEAD